MLRARRCLVTCVSNAEFDLDIIFETIFLFSCVPLQYSMGACKKPCDADKICNEKTSRCVLRTGKIGQQILGGGQARAATPSTSRAATPSTSRAAMSRTATPSRAAAKLQPLTLAEVRRSWPKRLEALTKSKYFREGPLLEKWGNKGYPWWNEKTGGLEKYFGPGATYVNKDTIGKLVPKPGDTARIAVVHENIRDGSAEEFAAILDPKKVWTVTLRRPLAAKELLPYKNANSDSVRRVLKINYLDPTKYTLPTDAAARRLVIATADSSAPKRYVLDPQIFVVVDPVNFDTSLTKLGDWGMGDSQFITWLKKPRNNGPSRNWSGPGVPVVNAANRGAHKVPAGRKAPAGHAKSFAGKTARGLDGKMWASEQVKIKGAFTWRWKPSSK
jgi:hypothetical protein